MQPSTLKINDQFISFVPINYNRNRWMNKKELGEKRYFRTDMPNTIHVRSISEVHQAFGLKPPKHPLISVIPITNRFNDIDFGDAFYAFDVYIVALKQGIEGTIYYGRNSYDYQDGTIVFSQPGQSSQFKAHPKNIQFGGWIVAFHSDLIRKSELGKTIDLYSFFSYEVSEALHLSKEEQESLTEITKKIEKEYTQNTDQYSDDLMISNVKLLLDYCTRYYNRQFKTRSTFDKDFVSEFESLLKEYFQSETQLEQGIPTVKYCGEQLNMSPYYLSDLLRKETGRNAQECIYRFVIDKAKTRLLGSRESISEVAYGLGFKYPNHFSKLFRNKTGMSPGEFRNLN